ncbi:MAG TPA: hypothetical protein VFR28_09955 [Allosphingosinicella sp.]|nr:hypothetical protein [Allosphingosinicella sp.]
MEGFRPLDSGARAALRVVGLLLILAGVACGLLWFVTYGPGLVEPGHRTGLRSILVACQALFGPLLLLTGIVSVRCDDWGRLRLVGGLAAVAAATLLLCFILQMSAA